MHWLRLFLLTLMTFMLYWIFCRVSTEFVTSMSALNLLTENYNEAQELHVSFGNGEVVFINIVHCTCSR